MNRPELFDRYLLLSPSLWFDDGLLLKEIGTIDFHLEPTRLYMASGKLERRIDDLQVRFMDDVKRLNPPNLQFKSEVLDDETHRTIFGAGFTNGLRFIYDPPAR